MTFPQAQLNAAAIRTEARDRRRIAASLLAATALTLAVVTLAAMALHLAVHLPDLMAQAAARAAW